MFKFGLQWISCLSWKMLEDFCLARGYGKRALTF